MMPVMNAEFAETWSEYLVAFFLLVVCQFRLEKRKYDAYIMEDIIHERGTLINREISSHCNTNIPYARIMEQSESLRYPGQP